MDETSVQHLGLDGVWTYLPRRFGDARGWFSETFNAAALKAALGGITFVQDNQVLSHAKGVLRGLHFQTPPRAQDKLVRVLRGSILDVAVDIRRASPTYGRWLSARLSADDGKQIFVPKGFAHGYLTLEPATEVLYKVSDYYSPQHEGGLLWSDPQIGVDWTLSPSEITIAERDRLLPRLDDLAAVF